MGLETTLPRPAGGDGGHEDDWRRWKDEMNEATTGRSTDTGELPRDGRVRFVASAAGRAGVAGTGLPPTNYMHVEPPHTPDIE